MKIIKDLDGREYQLTNRYLAEFPLSEDSRYVILRELVAARTFASISGYEPSTPVRYLGRSLKIPTRFSVTPNYLNNRGTSSLGCRTFDPDTYQMIIAAANAAVAIPKEAKK